MHAGNDLIIAYFFLGHLMGNYIFDSFEVHIGRKVASKRKYLSLPLNLLILIVTQCLYVHWHEIMNFRVYQRLFHYLFLSYSIAPWPI